MATQIRINIGSGNGWCLTVRSHYWNQYWLIINKVQGHWSEGNFTRNTSIINHQNYRKYYLSNIPFKFPRGAMSYKSSYIPSLPHYNDVIMTTMASKITSLTVVCSTVYSDADERKHQSSASLAFVWGNSPGPANSPHKGPVTRKMQTETRNV